MRIAVFASGGGTNLQALLDYFNTDIDRGGRIKLVISDRASAAALRRAANAGVATSVIAVTHRHDEDAATAMLAALREENIGLIALAGYLRLVPSAVIDAYRDRVINIHPALLPAFGGAGMYGERVHQAVLAAGCMVSGATVHYVDERYDEGRIIAQWPVPVLPGDDAATLATRVLRTEHALFPVALEAVIRRMTGASGANAAGGASAASSDAPSDRLLPHDLARVRDRVAFELRCADTDGVAAIVDLLNR